MIFYPKYNHLKYLLETYYYFFSSKVISRILGNLTSIYYEIFIHANS